MLEAALEALSLASGRSRSDLDTDRTLVLALTRLVEVMCEAARTTPDSVRALSPTVKWRKMAGTRNRLVHAYWNVDLDILWEIIHFV